MVNFLRLLFLAEGNGPLCVLMGGGFEFLFIYFHYGFFLIYFLVNRGKPKRKERKKKEKKYKMYVCIFKKNICFHVIKFNSKLLLLFFFFGGKSQLS